MFLEISGLRELLPAGYGVSASQIEMFRRLERFDVEFDLPKAFLPEFPRAIFVQNRPEIGDVSRGEVVSVNDFACSKIF